ncbi:MAG: NAD(P)H-binding protein [Bacteroidetes bacterium]|nr:NAD(P)H-binding protein [Bacteroidota bacterium]
MKIAITAVSGQLGRAIAEKAIATFGKENVVGTARTPEKVKDLDITIFKADYNSKEDFVKAFQEIEAVLLVSGMDKPEKRSGQHKNVINAAKESGVRKMIYTSIIGKPGDSTFDAVINSNRQTEEDIKNSGMDYAIGRNGLYIEPDIDYFDNYEKEGKIINCAGLGKCSYTSRDELAVAYTQLIKNDSLDGQVYNLAGEAITQKELVDYFNRFFNSQLIYESVTPEEYLAWQKIHNGDFLGTIIAGIYTKIRHGEFNVESDFEKVTKRKHKKVNEILSEYTDHIID